MKTSEVVLNFVRAMESCDFTEAEGYLAYDFILSGLTPQPMSKRDFMNLMQTMLSVFPDWSFNVGDIKDTDNQTTLTQRITGTHTADIHPLFPGMQTVPASGKRVCLPEEAVTVTARGNRIVEMEVERVPGGGIEGLLEQLGVESPAGCEMFVESPLITHDF